MSQNTKDWIRLISLLIGSGAAVTVTAATGGAKLWIAVLCGLGTGATNLFHALSDKPGIGASEDKPKSPLPLILLFAVGLSLLCGCGTLYNSIVTVNDVETAAMKEWAKAHNDGKTSEALDRKVLAAHAAFNRAKLDTKILLEAYKANGDKSKLEQSLAVVRAAIEPVLDLIAEFNAPKAASLQTAAANATKP